MDMPNAKMKTAILKAALPNVPFDGWTQDVLMDAAVQAGFAKNMIQAVFPAGVKDALGFFSQMLDEQMLARLTSEDTIRLRMRDKIARAVQIRFECLEPYKEAERLAIAFWMRPFRKWEGARLVWKTADAIWNWAGDVSDDYNRYTKRGLLSGVIVTTTLFWLNDKSADNADTKAFLDRRIDNVLQIGKIVGKKKTA